MKRYLKTHPKHILLCLLYMVLTCVQQVSENKHQIFYSVYPLLSLYYGFLSIPKVHKMHEYNTVEHCIPKWTYLIRIYYHVVLLDSIPFVGIISSFLILIIMMWKDIRFLIMHAEKRLKIIDEKMYSNNATKGYRIKNLHLDTFDDDTSSRFHTHQFNVNMLDIVQHSYKSEEDQNAIKNYVAYRRDHLLEPKMNTEWERKMWAASKYDKVFIQNREILMFAPFIYILCGAFICFPFAESQKTRLLVHLNTILLTGDALSTVTMKRLSNDVFVDVLYLLCSTAFLVLTSHYG